MKIFKDRKSAGKLLSKHLKQYKGKEDVLVLGIPRGGVVVAQELAHELNLPLDIIVTRKIGAPNQPELALGAVDSDGKVVLDQELKIENLKFKIDDEIEEIKRREQLYRQGKKPPNVENKIIILVDDGIATGATTLAAINFLKRHKAKKIILAVPVASKEALERIIRGLGDFGEVVILETPENFEAVGQFYQYFEPVEDQEVIQYLKHE